MKALSEGKKAKSGAGGTKRTAATAATAETEEDGENDVLVSKKKMDKPGRQSKKARTEISPVEEGMD